MNHQPTNFTTCISPHLPGSTARMSSEEQVAERLADIEAQIDALELVLQPYTQNTIPSVLEGLSPLEGAKIQVVVAYCMETLFYRILRLPP